MFLDPSHRTETSISRNLGAKARYHPSLVRVQCASLFLAKAKYMVLASGREFLKYLCHVSPPVTQSLWVDIFPQQGQPLRTAWFPKLGKEHWNPGCACCSVEALVEWEAGREAPLCRENISSPSGVPQYSGVRARSLRPTVLSLTELSE